MSGSVENDLFIQYYDEYLPLIKSTLRKYFYLLDDDDRESCGMNALLRCMRTWKSDRKVKFGTFLVNLINWECGVMIKQRSRYKDIVKPIMPVKEDRCYHFLSEINLSLNEKELELFCDRFMYKFTLAQMAEKHRVCRETIRKKLINIREKLKVADANKL